MLFERRDLPAVLRDLRSNANVTAHRVRPPVEPRFGQLPNDLHPTLRAALAGLAITRPYIHQARAYEAIRAGRHVVITTPTASGKTLCYNLPILDRMLREPEARALYVFPTKALSADQYTGLHQLIERCEADIATYTFDGDTPPDARRAVRDHGDIVITNPDMLHSGILPQHPKWLKLFENLRYVVIDELHTYRGVFGSHVANLVRRLRRVARFHGSDPQFICSSATIANPGELAAELLDVGAELISESGAPRGEHHLVCYNPPVVNAQLGIRRGVVRSSVQVAADLITSGVSTIVFAGSRLHVEIILKYLREELRRAKLPGELVQGYRGGYLPKRRRGIEAGLRNGSVQAVVATNALELGVDIGSLDACVIAGYPGSVASLWQQSGRAGRRSGQSLTVFIARSNSQEQYLVNHPDVLLNASPEHARIDPNNVFVLLDHLKCAAFELPFEPAEAFGSLSPQDTTEALDYLVSHGVLNESAGRYHWMERVYPATHVGLRGISEQNFVVIEVHRDRIIAEVDFRSTHTTLHQHAIYHLDGQQYQVERLDYDNHKAFVRRVDPDYYTTAMTYSRVAVLEEEGSRPAGPLSIVHGEVLVTTKFVGFKKVKFHTNENVGYGDIHLPDLEMHTTACWFTVPDPLIEALPYDRATALDGLVALSHALKAMATVTLMCSGGDLGRSVGDRSAGTGIPLDPDLSPDAPGRGVDFQPTVFLYDNLPGGVGLAGELHKRFDEVLARACDLLKSCDCGGSGCPTCLGPMRAYDGGSRAAAIALGRVVLDGLRRPGKPTPKFASQRPNAAA